MASSTQRRASYLRAAFLNLYNLTSLAGLSVAALATSEPWLLGVGFALESLWMLFAPDNARFKRAIDARLSAQERLEVIKQMQEQAALLPSEDRQKVQLLGTRAAEVKSECLRNPRLQGDFMKDQLDRLDTLVAEFIHLAITANRCETYLNRSDTKQINRERDGWRRAIDVADDGASRELAQKNLAILEKRLTLINEMMGFVHRARSQMSLIQNTIALLRDQVMTMATPEALTVQLDELVMSVEAIRDATQEIEAVVGGQVSVLTSETAVPPSADEPASQRQRPTRVR